MAETWKDTWHRVVFEADTPAGKFFDIALFVIITVSVVAVALDTVPAVRQSDWSTILVIAEWIFTALFTIEYIIRLLVADHPKRYAASFYGVVDLLSFLPTYFTIINPSFRVLLVIRVLRLLRVFQVLHMDKYTLEANILLRALRQSKQRIMVFVATVLSIAVVMGALMFVLEGSSGFTSIPQGMYWAIVTMTTVGYGDLVPTTPLGKIIANFLMILGYGIIAVPTGVFSVELAKLSLTQGKRQCIHCGGTGHHDDAVYCKHCGGDLTGEH